MTQCVGNNKLSSTAFYPTGTHHNNVTPMVPSLKIQERVKLCPVTGYDEIYAGNTLGKVYLCLTKQ